MNEHGTQAAIEHLRREVRPDTRWSIDAEPITGYSAAELIARRDQITSDLLHLADVAKGEDYTPFYLDAEKCHVLVRHIPRRRLPDGSLVPTKLVRKETDWANPTFLLAEVVETEDDEEFDASIAGGFKGYLTPEEADDPDNWIANKRSILTEWSKPLNEALGYEDPYGYSDADTVDAPFTGDGGAWAAFQQLKGELDAVERALAERELQDADPYLIEYAASVDAPIELVEYQPAPRTYADPWEKTDEPDYGWFDKTNDTERKRLDEESDLIVARVYAEREIDLREMPVQVRPWTERREWFLDRLDQPLRRMPSADECHRISEARESLLSWFAQNEAGAQTSLPSAIGTVISTLDPRFA